jgi:hypothetical protein
VHRLAEGGARALLVLLRPERDEQPVAAVEAPARRRREVGQQREPLALGDHRVEPPAVAVEEVRAPEEEELDHADAT